MTYYYLLSKFIRINRAKLRDARLIHNKSLSIDEKQARLFDFYLYDPEYQQWLDRQTSRRWM
jgi:hypothetical protein